MYTRLQQAMLALSDEWARQAADAPEFRELLVNMTDADAMWAIELSTRIYLDDEA